MIDVKDDTEYEVAELICLKCLHRWIGVYPQKTLLKQLECECGAVGYVIKTGQTVEDTADRECDTCKLYVNKKCKLGLSNSEEYYCEYYRSKSEEN